MWLKRPEIAKKFGVSEWTVRFWLKRGCPKRVEHITPTRKRFLFNEVEVKRWLEERLNRKIDGSVNKAFLEHFIEEVIKQIGAFRILRLVGIRKKDGHIFIAVGRIVSAIDSGDLPYTATLLGKIFKRFKAKDGVVSDCAGVSTRVKIFRPTSKVGACLKRKLEQ